jgi:hypothetical protein
MPSNRHQRDLIETVICLATLGFQFGIKWSSAQQSLPSRLSKPHLSISCILNLIIVKGLRTMKSTRELVVRVVYTESHTITYIDVDDAACLITH